MPTELYAGTLTNFNDSMAKEIENALTALIGPLPSAPQKLVDDRRVLFIAIANGVINHLKSKQAAVEVTFDIGFGTVTASTDIKVRP
ncbi:MAG TPA: hypothetical protein VJA21_16830 [Verrucomicrobiae bacterium]